MYLGEHIYIYTRRGLVQSIKGCSFPVTLVVAWALEPLGDIIAVLNEGFGVDFTFTLFKGSLALLKVGSVAFGANDGDDDDELEGDYDTKEDTLILMIGET
jgi:hypothetical protein